MRSDFTLELVPTRSINKDEIFNLPEVKAFAEEAKQYFDDVYKEATTDLTQAEKTEFDRWWKNHESNTNFSRKANSAVLWAIGRGCG